MLPKDPHLVTDLWSAISHGGPLGNPRNPGILSMGSIGGRLWVNFNRSIYHQKYMGEPSVQRDFSGYGIISWDMK